MKEPYWFPAKKIGWGWGPPCTWQGWLVLIGFLVAMYGSAVAMVPKHMVAWLVLCFVLCAILVAICWAKGERPASR
jgi:hypothetical protein